ncbi:MAG TPA: exodeoxyribonuclease VII small subunit [Edaphobacter sp.]|nr:exodeoxyribonuclease VII small subunit [Edaphobacter sp.]
MADFERKLTDLEAVVARLEEGDLPLDESVRLFEEGMKLSESCRQELEAAEGRIQILMRQSDGKLQPREFEIETDLDEEIVDDTEDGE